MDKQTFASTLRDTWDAVEPSESAGALSSTSIRNLIAKGSLYSANEFWAGAARLAFVELLNTNSQLLIFSFIKGLNYKEPIRYGDNNWHDVFVARFYAEFPIGAGDEDNFFISLRPPTLDDYDNFAEFSETGYDVLDERELQLLASARDGATWLRSARRLYMNFFLEASSIFLIVHKRKQGAARYRLERSLGIAPDQRVFRARNVDDSRDVVVVKWDSGIDSAVLNWRKIRQAGVEMIDFRTRHALSPVQSVLVTELLMPLGSKEDTMRVLVDVLDQLSQLHRATRIFIHADLKPDNILKRADGSYWIIDWDDVSSQPNTVDNSVTREIYSPVWTSQSYSVDLPTSYRYDIQELWYAIVDLEKRREEAEYKVDFPGKRVPMDLASADTLVERDVGLFVIHQNIHQDRLPITTSLNALWPMIMALPERLPTSEIDYSNLVVFVQRKMTKRDSRISSRLRAEAVPESTCANCDRPTDNMKIEDEDGNSVHVCNYNCAALVNDAYMDKAKQRRRYTSAVRVGKTCTACGRRADSECVCGALFCSKTCLRKEWDEHQDQCSGKK